MLGRAVVLILLVLGGALAGCVGAPEDTPADGEAQKNAADNNVLDANESKVAPDGRGEISAFKETNKTETGTGGMMHSHDYWGSETRKVLLQRDMWFIPLPLIPCRSGSFPGGDCYPPGTSIADIDIPEPNLVYEGTDSVEVLFDNLRMGPVCLRAMPACPVTNTDNPVKNPVVKMKFDYLTAGDEPGAWRPGPDVTPGTPVVLKIKPTEADMPHQVKSLWMFRIYTDQPTSVLFNFTVTAVKGNAIVEWPPHPDLYADKTERTILDGAFKTETKGWAEYWINGNDANWVYPDRVISYGTERIEVTIEKGAFAIQGGAPAVEPDFFYLDYHNASFLSKMGNGDLSGGRMVDAGSDGKLYHFVIPVDAYGMDTPYGEQSRWAFRFMARYSSESCPDVDQSFQQGCQWFPYTLEYTMKIVAYGHSTAGGTEDVNQVSQSSGGTPPTPTTPATPERSNSPSVPASAPKTLDAYEKVYARWIPA